MSIRGSVLFFGASKSARKRLGIFEFYKDLGAFWPMVKIRDWRFWAKNDGAKVKRRQNGAFLEDFLNILGHFSRKVDRFLQKSKEIERFLNILKKTPAFSRWVEK